MGDIENTPNLVSNPMPSDTALDEIAVAKNGISADEIALYDRQIRLWGLTAQQKIRDANILLICIKGVGNEIAKNLVLAGVGHLTVIDNAMVTEQDFGTQFLVCSSNTNDTENRATAAVRELRKLNPRVNITADSGSVGDKAADYFAAFDIVIATDQNSAQLSIINTATRLHHKKFYAAGTHGFYGYIFSDLIQHEYIIEREKSNKETALGPETRTRSVVSVQTKKEAGKIIESVTKREAYSTWLLACDDVATLPPDYLKSRRRLKAVTPLLSCLRALWQYTAKHSNELPGHTAAELAEFTTIATATHKALGLPAETLKAEFLRSFLQNIGSEIAPITAIIGGQASQDIINVLGCKQQPIQNFVLLNGETMEAPTYPLHPQGELGEGLLPIWNSAEGVEIMQEAVSLQNGSTLAIAPKPMSDFAQVS